MLSEMSSLMTTGLLSRDRKSTRLNSSHLVISYAVFCLKKKNQVTRMQLTGDVRLVEPDDLQGPGVIGQRGSRKTHALVLRPLLFNVINLDPHCRAHPR